MAKMKKIISLLLAGIMITACFTFNAAADDTTTTTGEFDVYAMQVLSTLGVFEKAASAYDMDKSITRAEFAQLMARFTGHKGVYASQTVAIADVEPEYTYASDIAYVVEKRILTLDSTAHFRPADLMTYKETIEAFVTMLGFKPRVDVYGGGKTAYMRAARESGLLYDASKLDTARVTYGELVDLFYQSLEIPLLEVTGVYEENGKLMCTYGTDPQNTPLTIWHNTNVIKGLLTNIERGTTILGTNYHETVVRIAGYTFKLGEVDAEEYIGCNVKGYYNPETNQLITVIPDVNRNDIIMIDAEDVADFKNGTLYYYRGGRTASVSIPTSSDVVYNGVAVTYDKRSDAFDIDEGYILINKFTQGDVKQLTLITAYDTYIVGAKTTEYVIYDKAVKTKQLKADPEDSSVKIFDTDGSEITYADIKENDVLSVAESFGSERIRIMRSNKQVTGVLEKLSVAGSKKTFTIDGTDYELAKSYTESTESYPKSGSTVTLYLNMSGKVANAVLSEQSLYKYGFLKEVGKEDDLFEDDNLLIRIYDGSEVGTYECAKSFTVDNYKPDNADDAIAAIKKGSRGTQDRVYQPIRFRLNAEGKLMAIDTAFHNTDAGESEDSLRYLHRGNDPYNLGEGSQTRIEVTAGYNFGQKLIAANSESFQRWTVPKDPNAKDEYFRNGASWWPDGSFVVDGLTSRKSSLAAELIVTYKAVAENTAVETMYGFVKDVWGGINSEDMPVHKIFYINTEGSDSSMNTINDTLVYNADSLEGKGAYTVTPGDFIKFGRNGKDEINTIEVLYDAETKTWLRNTDVEGSFGYHLVTHGYVLQKDSAIVRLGANKPVNSEEMYSMTSKYFSTAPAVVYEYDSTRQTVTKKTNADLISYEQSSSNCSEIVAGGYNGAERIIVIYK